jgi:ankyrin repeat protein
MCVALDPSYDDVFATDSLGNNVLHYAAGAARIEVCKFFAGVVNTAAMNDAVDHKVGLKTALRKMKSFKSERSKSTRSVAESEVLIEGWLRKHKVGKSNDTRWTVLYRDRLEYFKRKSDKKPKQSIGLEVTMIKHAIKGQTLKGEDFGFEVHSPLLLDAKRNPHGRMYFSCESEVELQKWLSALRISDAMTEQLMNTTKGSEKDIVNLDARSVFVKATNNMGQTPLHVLALHDKTKWSVDQTRLPTGTVARRTLTVTQNSLKRMESKANLQSSARIVQVASWLCESGCDFDAVDNDGNTAAKFSVQSKHIELAAALAKKGANIGIKGNDGQAAIDLLQGEDVEEVCNIGRIGMAELPKLLGPPQKVPGGTYLSFQFEKLSHLDLECDNPYVWSECECERSEASASEAKRARRRCLRPATPMRSAAHALGRACARPHMRSAAHARDRTCARWPPERYRPRPRR